MKNNSIKKINAKIENIDFLSKNLAIFTIVPGNNKFSAGQFFILGVPGFGEAPFTPTNFGNNNKLEFLIKKTGEVTSALFNLQKNDIITFRGPYGNGFPFQNLSKRNILLIAGGCGLAPIKSALEFLHKNKKYFGNIQLFYGVNTISEIAFKKDLKKLKNDFEILISVINPPKKYSGNIGYLDSLISKSTVKQNSVAILCGPPLMYQNVVKKLLNFGITKRDIYLQLERKMYCGLGLCQHCTCGDKYVCKDGPVFSYEELEKTNTKI